MSAFTDFRDSVTGTVGGFFGGGMGGLLGGLGGATGLGGVLGGGLGGLGGLLGLGGQAAGGYPNPYGGFAASPGGSGYGFGDSKSLMDMLGQRYQISPTGTDSGPALGQTTNQGLI